MKHLATITMLAFVIILTGCKVRIVVPEGGRVVSQSNAYSCESGQTCTINVSDIYFNETFNAVPKSGYKFKNWKQRDSGLCGGTTPVPCTLATASFAGNDSLMQILESDAVYYLEPVFERVDGFGSSQNGTLYISAYYPNVNGHDTLAVNPETGVLIGGMKGPISGFTDLAFLNGQMYGIGNGISADLYKIDFQNKAATRIGSTGLLSSIGTSKLFTAGAAGNLYLGTSFGGTYQLNLSTGFATQLFTPFGSGYPIATDGGGYVWYVVDPVGSSIHIDVYELTIFGFSRLESYYLSNPSDYAIEDIAFTNIGLIGITESGGTLVRLDLAALTVTGFAAVNSPGSIFLQPGFTSGMPPGC